MTLVEKIEKRRLQRRETIVPWLLSAVGTAGIVVLYFLVPGFQPIELALLFIVVMIGAVGYTQRALRGVMTLVILYIATALAATFYRTIAPYVGTTLWVMLLVWRAAVSMVTTGHVAASVIAVVLSDEVTGDILAISFGVLVLIIWSILESASRASFQDTSLPFLRVLDNLGGVLIYLVIGTLVASLLFNTVGYGRLRRIHNSALLRPKFNQVLYLHYRTQSFWFSWPPSIYVYDLDQLRER